MVSTAAIHCSFCKHIKSLDLLILSTDYWHVVLAADQAYLGRTLVILKAHKGSLSELDQEEWQEFIKIVPRLENGYTKAFGSGRPFNWAAMMNDAYKQNNPSPHIHWHMRPRHKQSSTINDDEFNDPEYGHHYDRARKQLAHKNTLKEIISTIQKYL